MRFIYLFLLFIASFANAQVSDNFTDNDFTANPIWSGDDSVYTIVSNQLRSNKTLTNSTFYLSTPSMLANNCQWEFLVNLKFATSGTNYVDVYLTSDQADLKASNLNGYFVRIGGTSDNISLFKKTAGTNLALITGTASTLTSSSNNIIKVKVTRSASNIFTLSREFTTSTLIGNYTTEGTITDATFTTSSNFGISVTQSTASFFQKHYFDDFYVGPIITDVTAPSIVSSTVISNTQVDVLFDENVDQTSSQTLTNYNGNNGLGNPIMATRDASNFGLVHLTFPTSFANGLSNTVTVTNVQDLNANAIISTTTIFTYVLPAVATFKDVIINEIYADLNPLVGLPASQFIELYNKSANTYNLSGWKISDASGSSSAVIGNYFLAPNQYLIVCKAIDTAIFAGFGNHTGTSSFPTLNVTSDNLKLFNNALVAIDSVNYSDSWYQDPTKKSGGWSLELINPNSSFNCVQASNWIASNNLAGGTPGTQNSVYATQIDNIAPAISSVSAIDATHITVCFSEAISASQITLVSNYNINNGIGIPISVTANTSLTCIDLTLGSALTSSTIYTISLNNIADCSGNTLSTSSTTFTYYTVKAFDVVINEIMADPDPIVGLPAFEYVELYNKTAFPINLNNWSYSAGSTTKVITNAVIQAHGYLVLTSATAAASVNYPAGINFTTFSSFTLTNSGQTLILKTPQGALISSVTYSDQWYQDVTKKNGGWSLEQIDPTNPCAGMMNWLASNNGNGGTPGTINSVNAANQDHTPPQVTRVNVITPDSIQLYFNEPIDSTTMLIPAIYTIDNSIGVPTNVQAIAPDFMSVKLALATNLQTGTYYTITVNNALTDCVGNAIGLNNTARFALPETASANDIVINELLYDPKAGGVDFVEIYNRSNKVIDLKTMTLSQYDTVTNLLQSVQNISENGYLIFPKEYLVLSTDGNIIKSQYNTANQNAFLDMASFPSMNISGGTVCLASGITIIDLLKYTDKLQFPLLNITKGVSLERIDFNRTTQDFTNWHSAAEDVGFATPGYKNSQFNDAGETTIDNAIEITPEIFSPDEDGINDVTNINYNFETPGFIANITIYDSKGRVVKYLVRNELLGIKGTYSWDGINEEREKSRIGIYIVYVEVFNLSGKVKHYKKSCVLGGKL